VVKARDKLLMKKARAEHLIMLEEPRSEAGLGLEQVEPVFTRSAKEMITDVYARAAWRWIGNESVHSD
jgi:hypothetical protein